MPVMTGWLSLLHVKVTEKLIGTPATDEPNAIGVDAGAEEGHGAARPGGASRDIGRSERGVRELGKGKPHAPSEISRFARSREETLEKYRRR